MLPARELPNAFVAQLRLPCFAFFCHAPVPINQEIVQIDLEDERHYSHPDTPVGRFHDQIVEVEIRTHPMVLIEDAVRELYMFDPAPVQGIHDAAGHIFIVILVIHLNGQPVDGLLRSLPFVHDDVDFELAGAFTVLDFTALASVDDATVGAQPMRPLFCEYTLHRLAVEAQQEIVKKHSVIHLADEVVAVDEVGCFQLQLRQARRPLLDVERKTNDATFFAARSIPSRIDERVVAEGVDETPPAELVRKAEAAYCLLEETAAEDYVAV